jgi:hypothetical protein
VHGAEEHHALARKVLDQVGRILLSAEARRLTHGQSAEFDIPEALCPAAAADLPAARDERAG